MKLRFVLLAALAAGTAPAISTPVRAQAIAPRPWTPPPGAVLPDSARGAGQPGLSYVDGVPDTGQFLPDTTVLARVDDRVIRVFDFREGFFGSFIDFRPRPDSLGRAEFLNSMVNKEVMALTALQINRPLTFEDRSVMRAHTQRVLSNIVFQRLVADSARPTEAELRQTHRQLGHELRVKRITVKERETAEKVLEDLRGKRLAWKEAQARYSTATGDGPEGDIGWVRRAEVEPLIGAELFDVAPGQLSRVLHDAQGYHIALVVERRSVPAPAFDASRLLLGNLVAPVKMVRRIEEVRAMIRPRIGWQLDRDNVRWAASQFGETQLIRQNPLGSVIDLSGHLPEFAPADTGRVLARWRDGHYTLGMFMSAYGALTLTTRQNINNELAFTNQLETFALEPSMAQLALERGLDRDPLAVQLIERKREEILVEHMYSDSVLAQVRVTDADRERYYRDHYPEFHSYQQARYAVVHRWTKAGADSVVAALKAGASAHEILRADSLRGESVVGSIRDIRDDNRDLYQKIVFEEMRVGDVRRFGPFKEGDYEVLQVLTHDPGRQLELREVMHIVDESVRNLAAEAKLAAMLERQRAKRRITWHPERLASVKMADPALD
jgi:hypothetical protein